MLGPTKRVAAGDKNVSRRSQRLSERLSHRVSRFADCPRRSGLASCSAGQVERPSDRVGSRRLFCRVRISLTGTGEIFRGHLLHSRHACAHATILAVGPARVSRTADLYRVNFSILGFTTDYNDRGDCLHTRKSCKAEGLVDGIVDWNGLSHFRGPVQFIGGFDCRRLGRHVQFLMRRQKLHQDREERPHHFQMLFRPGDEGIK